MRSSIKLFLKLSTTLIGWGPRRRKAIKAFSRTLRERGLPEEAIRELTEIYEETIPRLRDALNFIRL